MQKRSLQISFTISSLRSLLGLELGYVSKTAVGTLETSKGMKKQIELRVAPKARQKYSTRSRLIS